MQQIAMPIDSAQIHEEICPLLSPAVWPGNITKELERAGEHGDKAGDHRRGRGIGCAVAARCGNVHQNNPVR
jgi:hypothetical protein